jgi:Glycosyl transferases group 1
MKKMPKLHVVTYGKDDKPSVRHRFLSGLDDFTQHFETTWSPSFDDPRIKDLQTGDVLMVQKRVPDLLWTLRTSRRNGAKLLYDFDDAMWTAPLGDSFARRWRKYLRLRAIIRRADKVTAANDYLANWARSMGADPTVLPMGVNLPPTACESEASSTTLFGWGGHPQSQYLLSPLAPVLKTFFENRPHCRFVVMSGKKPDLGFDFDWWGFDPVQEERFFSSIDVGIVPSRRNEFDLGKSPIKILQHFSYGRPVITNGLGATRELVSGSNGWLVDDDDLTGRGWETALTQAAADVEGRKARGAAGRMLVETRHDRRAIFERMTQMLVSLSRSGQEPSP